MQQVSDYDVFFFEAFLEEDTALRRHLPQGVRAGFTPLTIQESGLEHPPCPFISIRTQSAIPASWAGRLSAVLTRSTGYDHITRFFSESGSRPAAGYLPLYCNRSVAEHALLLWMGLLRKLPRQMRQFALFDRDGLTGGECKGRTLLVAGVGNIGSEVLRIGTALGMEALGVDIVCNDPDIRYVSIEEAIPVADVIVCAMNLTAENRGYFSYERLCKAKPGAVFVNISRGELSPGKDLVRLLDENRLGGVGLDVYENESELAVSLRTGVPSSNQEVRASLELMRRSNVILTPHNAFNTTEALERKAGQSAEQVARYLAQRDFIWQVPR